MVNIESGPRKVNGVLTRDQDRTYSRRPRGEKGGGQFAVPVSLEANVDFAEGESVSDSAPVKLGGVKESSLGTWNYPPPPNIGAEELARFWATVKLSDAVISSIEVADQWGRDYKVAQRHDWELEKQFQRPNGWSGRQIRKDPDGYERDRELSKSLRMEKDLVVAHVGIIYKSDLRDTVRIGAYWKQIKDQDESLGGEPGKIVFEFSDGERVTAPEIWERYRLWEIEDAWFGRVKYAPLY